MQNKLFEATYFNVVDTSKILTSDFARNSSWCSCARGREGGGTQLLLSVKAAIRKWKGIQCSDLVGVLLKEVRLPPVEGEGSGRGSRERRGLLGIDSVSRGPGQSIPQGHSPHYPQASPTSRTTTPTPAPLNYTNLNTIPTALCQQFTRQNCYFAR